jgi:hypothetical protein
LKHQADGIFGFVSSHPSSLTRSVNLYSLVCTAVCFSSAKFL